MAVASPIYIDFLTARPFRNLFERQMRAAEARKLSHSRQSPAGGARSGLVEGDRVSLTPTKIEGAQSAAMHFCERQAEVSQLSRWISHPN